MVATSCGVLVVVYTFTTFAPPTVIYANWPFMFRTILTWFVNWAGIEDCPNIKGGPCVKHLGFASVFQREPHLLPIRRRGNIGTEGGCLGNSGDDLVTFDIN